MSGFKIGRIFGVDVAIHPSWFLVLGFFAYSLATGFFPRAYPGWGAAANWTTAIVATLLLFVSVLAHEFGHALVARSQGIPVRNITLFVLGGVAQLEREPDSPGHEAWMAIAGPLVSAAIGGVTLGAAYLLPGPEQVVAVLAYLGVANLALLAFNLLPGFPLDGGRVLRALLWRLTHDVVRATRWAARGRAGVRLGLHRPRSRGAPVPRQLRRHLARPGRLADDPGGPRDRAADRRSTTSSAASPPHGS